MQNTAKHIKKAKRIIAEAFVPSQPGYLNVAGESFFLSDGEGNADSVTSNLDDDSAKGDNAFKKLFLEGFNDTQQKDLRRIFKSIFGITSAPGKQGISLPCKKEELGLLLQAIIKRKDRLADEVINYQEVVGISDLHIRYLHDHLTKLNKLIDVDIPSSKAACKGTEPFDPSVVKPYGVMDDKQMRRLLEIFAFLLAQGKDPVKELADSNPEVGDILSRMDVTDAPLLDNYEAEFKKEKGSDVSYTGTLLKIKKVLTDDPSLRAGLDQADLLATLTEVETVLSLGHTATIAERKNAIVEKIGELLTRDRDSSTRDAAKDAELAAAREKNAQCDADKKKCEGNLARLTAEKAAVDAKLAEANTHLSDAESTSKNCKAEIAGIRSQLQALQQQVNEIPTIKSNLDVRIAELEAQLAEKLAKLKAMYEKLHPTLALPEQNVLEAALTTRIDEIMAEAKKNKEKIQQQLQQITGLEGQIAQHAAQIAAEAAEKADLVKAAEAAVEAHKAEVAKLQDELAELEKKLQTLQGTLDACNAEKESLAAGFTAERTALQEQIDALTAQLSGRSGTNAEHAAAITAQAAAHTASLEGLKKQQKEAIQKLRDEHATALAAAQRACDEAATAKEGEHAGALQALQEKLDAAEAALARLRGEHADELARLRGEHTAALAATQAQGDSGHADELARLRAAHETEIQQLRATHASEIAVAQKEAADAKASLETTTINHAAALAEATQENARKLNEASSKCESEKLELAEKHRIELEAATAKIAANDAAHAIEIARKNADLVQVQAQLSTCQAEKGTSEAEKKTLKEQLTGLQARLDNINGIFNPMLEELRTKLSIGDWAVTEQTDPAKKKEKVYKAIDDLIAEKAAFEKQKLDFVRTKLLLQTVYDGIDIFIQSNKEKLEGTEIPRLDARNLDEDTFTRFQPAPNGFLTTLSIKPVEPITKLSGTVLCMLNTVYFMFMSQMPKELAATLDDIIKITQKSVYKEFTPYFMSFFYTILKNKGGQVDSTTVEFENLARILMEIKNLQSLSTPLIKDTITKFSRLVNVPNINQYAVEAVDPSFGENPYKTTSYSILIFLAILRGLLKENIDDLRSSGCKIPEDDSWELSMFSYEYFMLPQTIKGEIPPGQSETEMKQFAKKILYLKKKNILELFVKALGEQRQKYLNYLEAENKYLISKGRGEFKYKEFVNKQIDINNKVDRDARSTQNNTLIKGLKEQIEFIGNLPRIVNDANDYAAVYNSIDEKILKWGHYIFDVPNVDKILKGNTYPKEILKVVL